MRKRIVVLLVLAVFLVNTITVIANSDDLRISDIIVRPGNSVVAKCNFMDGKDDYFYIVIHSDKPNLYCKVTAEAEFSYDGEVLQSVTTDIKNNQINKDWIESGVIKFNPSEFGVPSGELYLAKIKIFGYIDSDTDGYCDQNPYTYVKKSLYSEICPDYRLTLFNSRPNNSFYNLSKSDGIIEIVQNVQNSGANEFCHVTIDTDYYIQRQQGRFVKVKSFKTNSSTVSEDTPFKSSLTVGAWTRLDPNDYELKIGDIFRISTKACGYIDADNDGVCDNICRSMSVMTEDKTLCDSSENCIQEIIAAPID